MTQPILDRLSDPRLLAVCIVGANWPRSFLSGTLMPDRWMGLVECADGRRRFVPAGEDPRVERSDRLLLVRNRPITVPLAVEEIPSASGHPVSAAGELLLCWEGRADDLAALARTLLDGDELTLDGLARAVGHAGAVAALQQFIRQYPAADLVHRPLVDEFLPVLREQLRRFLFSTGSTLERLVTLEFTSPALARSEALQREAAATVERIKARELVQQAALAATQRRLQDLSGIFEQLKSAAAGDDRLQWHELLPALSPADRGRLLENLWRLTPDRHRADALVVIAGQDCVWLDPADGSQVRRKVTLPAALGGLRSVSCCPAEGLLLIGAARGVWLLGEADGEVRARYEVPGVELPRTGFNAATLWGPCVVGSHSQLGVWAWPREAPDQCEPLFQPIEGVPRTVRGVTTGHGGWLLFTADDLVHLVRTLDAEQELLPRAPGVLQCLAVLDDQLYSATAEGCLLRMDLKLPDGWTIVHRAHAAIESVVPRKWNDLVELVIPAGSAGICGVYALEGFVARLLQTPLAIRRAWACDDLLVGLTEYRDRLVVMNADAPERTGCEVPLGRMLGRTVQDACIVTRTPADATGAARSEPRA